MLLGGGGNPSAWLEVDGVRGAHDGQRHGAAATVFAQGNDYVGVVGRDEPLRAGRRCGGRRSRPSRTRRAASSASTRAPASSVVAADARAGRVADGHRQPCRHDVARPRRGRARGAPTTPGPREPRPPRRPRPLLPAVAGRSVQRARAGRPDRGARPRLDGAGQRASATARTPSAGNLGRMSWDLGPTLAGWLEHGDPVAYRGFVDGDAAAQRARPAVPPHDPAAGVGRRPADRDRLGPARLRRGASAGPATGVWLPEGAVDLPTLRLAGRARRPPHDPRAVAGRRDARRDPPAVPGRASAAASRSSSRSTTAACRRRSRSNRARPTDADAFAAERVEPRLASGTLPDDEPPLVVIATDGELYGHHQPFRDLFLERLLERAASTTTAAQLRCRQPRRGAGGAVAAGRSGRPASSNGPRGAAITASCAGAASAPARRTGAGRGRSGRPSTGWPRGSTRSRSGSLAGWGAALDPWAARDAYVDVVIGAEEPAAFAARWLGGDAPTRRVGGHVPGGHGGAALAPRDVRERRLVLGRPGPARDGGRASCGGASGRLDRRPAPAERATLERRLVADLSAVHLTRSRDRWRRDLPAGARRGRPAGVGRRVRASMPTGYGERRGSVESMRLSTP